jgi:hypothetical protein
MSSPHLPSSIDNAVFHLERFIPRLAAQDLDWSGIQHMTTAYRQRAVCSLLLRGTTDEFYAGMMQSAGAFLHFLATCPEPQKITSQGRPFLDALDGGYWDAAIAIAQRSRKTWNRDREYEEDFLYVHQLMLIATDGASAEGAELKQLEAVEPGTDPERISLCRSLIDKDSLAFADALSTNLRSRREKVEAMIKRGALPEELSAWMRYFSGEGLALVRLAERRGMQTEPQYLHIPEAVRPVSPWKFDPQAWRTLDYQQ